MRDRIAGKRLTDAEREDQDLAKISRGNIKPPPSRKYREKRAPRKGARRKRVKLVDEHLMGTDPHLSRDRRIAASLMRFNDSDLPLLLQQDPNRLQKWRSSLAELESLLAPLKSMKLTGMTQNYIKSILPEVKTRISSRVKISADEKIPPLMFLFVKNGLLDFEDTTSYGMTSLSGSTPASIQQYVDKLCDLHTKVDSARDAAINQYSKEEQEEFERGDSYIEVTIDGDQYDTDSDDEQHLDKIISQLKETFPKYFQNYSESHQAKRTLSVLQQDSLKNPAKTLEIIERLLAAALKSKSDPDFIAGKPVSISTDGGKLFISKQTQSEISSLKNELESRAKNNKSSQDIFDKLEALGIGSKTDLLNILYKLEGKNVNEKESYVYVPQASNKELLTSIYKAFALAGRRKITPTLTKTLYRWDSDDFRFVKEFIRNSVRNLSDDWKAEVNPDEADDSAKKYFGVTSFKEIESRKRTDKSDYIVMLTNQANEFTKSIQGLISDIKKTRSTVSRVYSYSADDYYSSLLQIWDSKSKGVGPIVGFALGLHDLFRTKLKSYEPILPFILDYSKSGDVKKAISEKLISRKRTSRGYENLFDDTALKILTISMVLYNMIREDGDIDEREIERDFKKSYEDSVDIAQSLNVVLDVDNMVNDALKSFRRDKSVDIDDILKTKRDIGDSLNSLKNIQRNMAIAEAGLSWGEVFDMMIEHYEKFLPDDKQKVNLNAFLKSYLEGKKRAASSLQKGAAMNRLATYHGVLEQRSPEESGPKWTSIDKRYLGKEHYDSIIACAKEFLKDNWIAHWDGGAADSKFRAALDLAIHTADGAMYQSKIDAPTYNVLLNRLASLGNDMMTDTLLPYKVASADKSYINSGNEHTSSLPRKDMPMENAELSALVRVAFTNPDTRPALLPIIAAKMDSMKKKTSTKKKQAEMPEQLAKGLAKKKKTGTKKSGTKRKASVSVSFADARW